MVTCAQDVLDEYCRHAPLSAVEPNKRRSARKTKAQAQGSTPDFAIGDDLLAHATESLSPEEKKVFILLGSDPLHVDEIAGESGLTPMDVSSIVLHLELQGLINSLPGARYIRA